MKKTRHMPRWLHDFLLTAALLTAAVALCAGLRRIDEGGTYVGLVFVLAVAGVARWTEGYRWGVFASFFGVVFVNYVFTYPFWEFNFTMTGYPVTFLTMLTVAVMVSAMTTQIKKQERLRLESERAAMRADLLRAMSHDIRTPLTSIVGNTAALLENRGTLTDEQKRSLLRDVNEDAQWLIRMVENILSITRISGEDRLNVDYEAAEEILAEAVRKFSKRFPEVELAVEVPDEVLLAPMDATLIQQVLLNLMENAVIHGDAARVVLRLERKGENARFIVEDEGQGIPPNRLPALFDGSGASSSRGDGKKNMGIGLSVCRTIVKAHGGTMTAENTPKGAKFCFDLPLKEKEANETQG